MSGANLEHAYILDIQAMPQRQAPWPHPGHLRVICRVLARSVCIYHPLLNEPHLSTTDHHYPSIIKTNILQISYFPALLKL